MLICVIEDWSLVKQRWEAWWARQLHDRVLVQITAPRNEPEAPNGSLPSDDEVDPETKWTDFDYMIGRHLERIRTTYYGGSPSEVIISDQLTPG